MQQPANAYAQQWGYPQQWDQSQQQATQMQAAQGATGQTDYSAQWIEYYRSMGMHREAELIEQQLKAKQSGQQPAQHQQVMPSNAGAAPVSDTQTASTAAAPGAQAQSQPDYSAQWAEYYRSVGKIAEAEAIENQIKATKVSFYL